MVKNFDTSVSSNTPNFARNQFFVAVSISIGIVMRRVLGYAYTFDLGMKRCDEKVMVDVTIKGKDWEYNSGIIKILQFLLFNNLIELVR